MATKQEQTTDPQVERLVRVYLKMKNKRDEITAELKEKEADLKEQMEKVKSALLDYCKENGLNGARTDDGTFYRTVTTKYWSSDWNALGEFVVEHNVPELFEKRLHQGNVKQFLEEHPDESLPGLQADTQYQVSIRAASKK